ncbi:hypothetical protein [Bifidobacterium stellenboschense]|uniref:hypothetical protein n=1 Tax=Bifidobacterium stellenboschense TaxID=762211 RepID=UPI0012EBD7DB|nr:hypothetical protein [Bifidobacterium stellenboschense]
MRIGRALAAMMLCGALAIGLGACGSSNASDANGSANGSANSSQTSGDSSKKSEQSGKSDSDGSATTTDGSDSASTSSDASGSGDASASAAPVDITGTYEFSDFGKDCTKDCKITVTVKDGMISAVMSDDFGEYPYWYGTVDSASIAKTGKWTSKADPKSAQGRKVAKSEFGSEDSTKEFTYDAKAKSINFDLKFYVRVNHVKAKLVG